MIALSLIFTTLAIFLSFCYWKQTRSHAAKLSRKFPVVAPIVPLLGHVQLLKTKPDELFIQTRKFTTSFKETFAIWGGYYGSLHIITADDAEKILSNINCIDKGMVYTITTLGLWLREGLLTSTGAKWHQRRKMLTPAFHYNILNMYVEVFGYQCKKLIEKLKEECSKGNTNIVPIITETTLKTICESAMGIKLEKNDERQKHYLNALHGMNETIIKIITSPWLYVKVILYMSPLYLRARVILKALHSFTSKIIKRKEETFKASDVGDLELSNKQSKKRLAMLDLLLYAKRQSGQIDDDGIQEEVDTFIFEGHDTISAAICFSLLLLARHDNVQQKIINELDEIFSSSSRHATYDDLQNMKYLERCLKECLRIYPSVPLIIRNIKEDVPLTHHVAPAGAEVFIHIYDIHRDTKYFPDPEKFDPDRFLPENSKGRHPFAYIPFSAGPRNCIGQKFAMLELKSIVSSIFRDFTLEPVESPKDLTWVVDLVLRVKGPIHIKFKPRF